SMLDRAGEFCIARKRIMRDPMRAPGWCLAVLLALSTNAAADPKPRPVDVKPIRGSMIVLQDADGGIYVVSPGNDSRLFYGVGGKNKNLYEQIVFGRYSDGSTGAWDMSVWAPRVPHVQPGGVQRNPDGSYARSCGSDSNMALTELSG